MYGYCYALAYELAPVMNYPIEMLFASRPDEGRISDPLHVYLRINDRDIFDIKGRRSFKCMRQDFESLLGLLRRSENDILLTETETLFDRDDLFDCFNFDPEGLEMVNDGVWDFISDAIRSSDMHNDSDIAEPEDEQAPGF